MTLDQLSYQQRQTLRGLQWIGGTGKRLQIAEAADLDGTKVASALTALREAGLVEKPAGLEWALSDAGAKLLAADVPRRDDDAPPPTVPAPASFRQALDAELRRLAPKPAPAGFSADDAAFLCAAMRDQFADDMPAISAMFGQMAAYWSGLT